MTDFSFPAGDGLVDALLTQVAGPLRRLIDDGDPGKIDLRGLPLSPLCENVDECRAGVWLDRPPRVGHAWSSRLRGQLYGDP